MGKKREKNQSSIQFDENGNIIMTPYLDIVPIQRGLSLEELRERIEQSMKEDEELTEWPDV